MHSQKFFSSVILKHRKWYADTDYMYEDNNGWILHNGHTSVVGSDLELLTIFSFTSESILGTGIM